MTTAYTSVGSRRTLTAQAAPIPAMAQQSQPAAPARKVLWSDSVKQYVQRAFGADTTIPGVSKQDVEAKLKQVLTEAAEAGQLDDIDWNTYPLPQQLVQQERAFAAQNLWNGYPQYTNYSVVPSDYSQNGLAKKRKLDDQPNGADLANSTSSTPPWRKGAQPVSSNPFEDRVSYSAKKKDREDKRQRKQHDQEVSSKFQEELEKRKQRFEGRNRKQSPSSKAVPWSRSRDESSSPVPSGPIVGTSETLEKNYFRLTSAPKPSDVRPQRVLEKTLVLLKQKWRKEGNYGYICDQFKSMRQDLTVQHIKNSFTVDVYELHARIALEKGDMGEYNQCQTQLRGLYAQGLGGHPDEFLAYRILYFIHTANNAGLNEVLSDLTPADKRKPAVKHALDTRSAVASKNYHRLFRLYLDPPNMGAYLMDMFIARERIRALTIMCKSYKPKINIKYLTDELGFESYGQTVEFIAAQGAEASLEQVEGTGEVLLNPTTASPIFEQAKASAFRLIDIKGQI